MFTAYQHIVRNMVDAIICPIAALLCTLKYCLRVDGIPLDDRIGGHSPHGSWHVE